MARIDLSAVTEGLVIAPAGCGKTQLIVNAIQRHDEPKPILVLTHTNAGVAALRARLDGIGVGPQKYRLATIDGFAIRIVSMFPQRANYNPASVNQLRPNYRAIRVSALNLVSAGHINDVLKASYARVLVDEYQDCSIRQHSLVSAISDLRPVAVVGDPLQSIFGFGDDPLASWETEVVNRFPIVGELTTPWRWINAGAAPLGEWLLVIRGKLTQGHPIDLRTAPQGVEWIQLDGQHDDAIRQRSGAVEVPDDTKVLIIGDSTNPAEQRRFARRVPGAITVEAVDLRDLTEFGATLDLTDNDALAHAAAFAESLMTAFSGDDLVRAVKAIQAGRFAHDPTELERFAIAFEEDRSYPRLSDLLAVINRTGGVRCFRPSVLAAAQRALQLAAVPGGPSFHDATLTIREQARLIGRPLAKRSVGSTLLLKGLEAEVSVILNAEVLDAHNLYVAMTRGSQRLLVCSTSPVLRPQR